MKYTLVSSSSVFLPLSKVKEWINVTHDLHDELLQALINSATIVAEDYTGIALRNQTWQLDASPSEMAIGITLAKNPVSNLVSIKSSIYNELQELDDKQYVFELGDSRSFIVVIDNQLLRNAPIIYNAFEVVFEAGLGKPSEAMETTLLMIIAFFYENRGDVSAMSSRGLPPEILHLLQSQRVGFV